MLKKLRLRCTNLPTKSSQEREVHFASYREQEELEADDLRSACAIITAAEWSPLSTLPPPATLETGAS